jgi:cytoskeletal protein CcmA (bactofilin family)
MFGNNKKPSPNNPSKTSSSSSALSVNSLVEGTSIEGKIHAKNDIRVDGFIDGELNCDGKLIVGKEGKIEGIVTCENAVIEGQFNGKLRVRSLLHVKDTAFIDGEVKTGQLLVDPGGVINGTCEMGSQIKNLSTKEDKKSDVGT